jgi:hypothetical protein
MAEKSVDFALNTVQEILEIPYDIVSKGLIKPLLEVDVKVFFATSLILLLVTYILLDWESGPGSCRNINGVCYKIFKGGQGDEKVGGALQLISGGLSLFALLLVVKLVARGVSQHGLKPSAFVGVATLFGLAEFFKILLEDLFQVAITDETIYEVSPTPPIVGNSFKVIMQKYLWTVIESFRLYSGSNANSTDKVGFTTYAAAVGPLLAVLVGTVVA